MRCCVDALQSGASQFETNTGKLKRKYWWQNVKVRFSVAVAHVLDTLMALHYLNLKKKYYEFWSFICISVRYNLPAVINCKPFDCMIRYVALQYGPSLTVVHFHNSKIIYL